MELAFDMTPGQENLFDFIDDVFAAADALYAANTPAAFGMALRFTGTTEALLGMQQRARTCIVEIFMLRGVASTVARLRAVLGDTPDRPRFIETLPRRGYRFIGALAQTAVQPVPVAQLLAPTEDESLPE